MVVAWIVAVWLLSLAVFVALRAHRARDHERRLSRRSGSAEIANLPAQRDAADSPSRASHQG
jgi:hypothetical protein